MAKHVCPLWVGYLLASPLRKLLQSPRKILAPHVASGMWVMDIGCAMGFFSLPLAQLVGVKGRVICVDLQEKMLAALRRRARRAHLSDWIETRVCGPESLRVRDLAGRIDFVLAFAVVHEVPDPARLFADVYAVLKAGGRALLAEPKGHIARRSFQDSVSTAEDNGFHVVASPGIAGSHAALLSKV